MENTIYPNTLIYSLGGGCWSNNDIPLEIVSPSVFHSAGTVNPKIFTPLLLFNGKLEKELKDYNSWNSFVRQSWIDKWTMDIFITGKISGLCIGHLNQIKDPMKNITIRETLDYKLDFFNKNKYNQFFIIDFQRGDYDKFTNNQLLEFEDFLISEDYDLSHFVYLDVSTASDKNRFNNTKIPSFVQDVNDESGFGHKLNPQEFRNTRSFLKIHDKYVEQILSNIKNSFI